MMRKNSQTPKTKTIEERKSPNSLSYLDGIISKAETLLDDGGELANAAALLAEDILGAGGEDDDLGTLGGGADLNTRVALRL